MTLIWHTTKSFAIFEWSLKLLEDRSYSPKVIDQQTRSPQATFTPNNHASKELALWCSHHPAWMGASHGSYRSATGWTPLMNPETVFVAPPSRMANPLDCVWAFWSTMSHLSTQHGPPRVEMSTCMVVIVRSSRCPVPPPYVLCPLPLLVSNILSLPSPLFLFLLHLILPFLFPLSSSLLCLPSLPSFSLLSPVSVVLPWPALLLWEMVWKNWIVFDFIWCCFFDFQSIENNVFWRWVASGVLDLWMIPVWGFVLTTTCVCI